MPRSFLRTVALIAVVAIGACKTDGTSPSGTPVTINWSPCIGDANAPAWFAFQDGSGAWTTVASTAGVFSFTVSSGKVGVATYANGELSIVYATTDEMNTVRPACTGSRRTVTGTVTGYAGPDATDIEMDQGGATISGSTTSPASFQLSNVAPGAVDVLAVRSRSTVIPTFQQTPSAVFIRRAQSSSPLAVIDLNSTVESGAPVSRTATVTGVASSETLFAESSLNTSTSAITMSLYSVALGTVAGNVAISFYGLSGTRLSAGDKQQLVVSSTNTLSGNSSETRYGATTFTDATDQTVTLGAPLGTVKIAGTSRPSASYAIQTGYDQFFQLSLDQGSGVSSKSILVLMTRAYAGTSATAVTLLVPDLTGASGFLPAWLLTTGSTATWTFYASSEALRLLGGTATAFTAADRTAGFTP
jgi:hypothetical protein